MIMPHGSWVWIRTVPWNWRLLTSMVLTSLTCVLGGDGTWLTSCGSVGSEMSMIETPERSQAGSLKLPT